MFKSSGFLYFKNIFKKCLTYIFKNARIKLFKENTRRNYKMKKFTLADAIKLGGDRDITDNTFDYLNYFDCSEEPHDAYDKVMLWLAQKIIVTGGDRDVIHCNITEFITDNQYKFKRLAKHVYNKWYFKETFANKISSDDEEFYDTYMVLFSDMINGNLSTDDYEWFVEQFLMKGGKQ